MREKLRSLKPLQRAMEEELVNAAVMSSSEWQRAGTVVLYHHKGAEFSVNSLGNQAFRVGKEVAFPRVEGGELTLAIAASWQDLEIGSFGILEPKSTAQILDPTSVDITIVPGLAWTIEGARLGQGGGFYDRLLPALGGTAWGVGFDCQLLHELPVEPHDQPVDRVWHASKVVET